MKRNRASYFVGIVFICIIAFFFCSVGYRVYRAGVYNDYGENASETTTTAVDKADTSMQDPNALTWPDIYPFSDDYKFVSTVSTEAETTESDDSESSKLSKYLSTVDKIENAVDYYTTKLLPGRMTYVEINTWFNKHIGINIIVGNESVSVMKNGYLTFNISEKNTEPLQQSLKWFSDIMKEKGVDFAYIQYPSKECETDNQLTLGSVDNSNKNASSLLSGLDSNGVKYLDLRKNLAAKDNDWYSNFFKTDHHWKPETGVWASGQIIDMLNNDFGYSFDNSVGDLSNYKVDVYEKISLGSQGKIATLSYADPEDFSLIYPKTETSITVQYNIDPATTGRFEDVIFNKKHLNSTDYYNYSAYSTYLDGNKALTRITNNNCKNGKHILIIGDSYNKSVAPYLSLAVEKVDLLDRRYFDGSIVDYVDKNKPDIVLVCYMPASLTATDTHNSTFNFE